MYRIHERHKSGIGGTKRQDELSEIYQLYNPFYGELFEKLRGEKNINLTYFENKIFNILKLIYGRGINNIHFLKLKKYSKYKNYRAKEMEIVINML